jgi:ribosome maturation factor RimP
LHGIWSEEAEASSFFRYMILEKDIKNIAEERIKKIGGYLVDIKISYTNDITILFDKLEGVNFNDCSDLSRYIEERFDRDEQDYSLTVCSPGIDKPFLVEEQYRKNIGKEVKVLLKDGKRKTGEILAYNDTLILSNKKRSIKSQEDKIVISKEDIKETKLKINFK